MHDPLLKQLHSAANRLGLVWRNLAGIEWLPYREPAGDKSLLFQGNAPLRALADRYGTEYELGQLCAQAAAMRYRENLACLAWLEWFLHQQPDLFHGHGTPLRWLDAGAGNWSYVEALYRFIKRHAGRDLRLDGVELDTGRRYLNLRTRRQAAMHHIRHLPGAHYHSGNVLDWQEPAHIISQILPFVFEDPLLAWGLPLEHFRPMRLLSRLVDLLMPGGFLLIVNQGEAEAAEQESLLRTVAANGRIGYKQTGELPDPFSVYRHPRYGWICRKAP